MSWFASSASPRPPGKADGHLDQVGAIDGFAQELVASGRQAGAGHRAFTCATIREVEGMVAAGLGEDLLLANEVIDCSRLGRLDARVTVAVDSEKTIEAARAQLALG